MSPPNPNVSVRRREQRHAPFPVRQTSTARYLAQRGAMAPEGVTAANLERSRNNHRLNRAEIKAILLSLWKFRLLGWLPGDISYLTYEDVVERVSRHERRPADTQDLMPHWFTIRQSADDLEEYRKGKDI